MAIAGRATRWGLRKLARPAWRIARWLLLAALILTGLAQAIVSVGPVDAGVARVQGWIGQATAGLDLWGPLDPLVTMLLSVASWAVGTLSTYPTQVSAVLGVLAIASSVTARGRNSGDRIALYARRAARAAAEDAPKPEGQKSAKPQGRDAVEGAARDFYDVASIAFAIAYTVVWAGLMTDAPTLSALAWLGLGQAVWVSWLLIVRLGLAGQVIIRRADLPRALMGSRAGITAGAAGLAGMAGWALLTHLAGEIEWAPAVAVGVIVAASVGGSAATSLLRREEQARDGVRRSLAAVLGVTSEVLDAHRWHVEPAGWIRMERPSERILSKRDGLAARVAEFLPEWEIAAADEYSVHLVPVTSETQRAREVLASSEGLVVITAPAPDAEGSQLWTLAPEVGPAAAPRIAELARAQGLELAEWQPHRHMAVVAKLDAQTATTRARLADFLGWMPWDLELMCATDNANQITGIEVTRAPQIPDRARRRERWMEAVTTILPPPAVHRWSMEDRSDLGRLAFTMHRDPLAETAAYPEALECNYDAVPFGVTEARQQLSLGLLEKNVLLGGVPGGGKSGGLTALMAGVATLPHVAMIGLDPKRVELASWGPRFSHIATEGGDALTALELIVDEMERRYEWLARRGLKKVSASVIGPEMPLLVVFIDELADLVSIGVTPDEVKEDKDRAARVRRLIAKGRAAGIVVVAATQKPQSDVVPTALRDLIQLRVSYATTTPDMTETILGKGMAEFGAAHEIPTSLRGVCYVLSDESRTPVRARTYWIPDEDVPALAHRTAHLRVDLPWLTAGGLGPKSAPPVQVVDAGELEVSLDDLEALTNEDDGLDWSTTGKAMAEPDDLFDEPEKQATPAAAADPFGFGF